MNSTESNYKKQLYPSEDEAHWKYDDAEFIPAPRDIGQIYCLIKQLVKNEKNDIKENRDEYYSEVSEEIDTNLRNFFRQTYKSSVQEENKLKEINLFNTGLKPMEVKIDIVKGSIYKIKKYFLENNNLKDIRGGSMMIDYLNITEVKNILKEEGFNEDNIIYCGGGNVLIVVPEGHGLNLCRKFEEQFTKISLTVMSAFEYISCSLWDLLFEFKDYKAQVENLVTERSKMKLYDINPNSDYDSKHEGDEIKPDSDDDSEHKGYKIKLDLPIEDCEENENTVDFRPKNEEIILENEKGVCELCHIRDAKYKVDLKIEPKKACPSCFRKHKVGIKTKKSKFYKECEGFIKSKYKKTMNIKNIDSINEISNEIAVIYGDGNNMGAVVKDIDNIFELMYFSRKTERITKESVYKALYSSMKKEARFEVIGLGGDDIFIIVPAKYAFEISNNIIEKFDSEFNNTITMSIGIAIGKYATPVSSLFSLAQSRLKNAKKMVIKKNLNQGTIDVIEIIGDMHSRSIENKLKIKDYNVTGIEDNNTKRLFPLANEDLKKCLSRLCKIKENSNLRTQLYKIGYARENMCEEEFQLFYFYQNSKKKANKDKKNSDEIFNVYDLIKDLNSQCTYSKDKLNNCEPYNINWNELILMYERGESYNE